MYSITHSPSLFDAPGTEACTAEQVSVSSGSSMYQ